MGNPESSQKNSFSSAGGDSHNSNGMRPNPITYATDKPRIYPVSGRMTPHQQQMTRLRGNYHGGKPTYDKNNQPGNRLNYQGNNYNPNFQKQNNFQNNNYQGNHFKPNHNRNFHT